MKGYAIGILRDVEMGPPIVQYLERIDATLEPYQGRFIVHGGPVDVREGANLGDVIIIEFPDRAHAERWYESAAYQQILPLRAENSAGTILLAGGVDEDHRATDILVGTGAGGQQ